MRQLLFIAHHFPPIGGAGVQRSLKFVKYLPEFGIQPTVITGQGKPSGRWSPEDRTLMGEIPSDVLVARAEDPVLPPDATVDVRHRLRHEQFLRKAREVCTKVRPDCILVTMSPFEDTVVAETLSRELGVPWIADLRDPWALDEFQVHRWFGARHALRSHMRRALASAALVIMNTPEATQRLSEAFPEFQGDRIACLTNGYDEADFSGPTPSLPNPNFCIVHAGFLHTEAGLQQRRRNLEYRLLGRTERGLQILPRSHYFLLQAATRLGERCPDFLSDCRVVLVGSPTPTDERVVRESRVSSLCSFTGYKTHGETVTMMRTANLLFMPMHALAAGERAGLVPGKAYEYMATGRPILAAVPPGDAHDFLQASGTARICAPDDVGTMTSILESEYRAWKGGSTASTRSLPPEVTRFERRNLTGKLSELINRVLKTAP